MMKTAIKARASAQVLVELDRDEAKRIAIELIQQEFDIPKNAYIKGNHLCFWWEESMGTHSSRESKEVRKATLDDIAAVRVLHKLMM